MKRVAWGPRETKGLSKASSTARTAINHCGPQRRIPKENPKPETKTKTKTHRLYHQILSLSLSLSLSPMEAES